MKETFAIPTVGAIIVKKIENEEFILVQNRKKIVDDSPECIFLMHVNPLRKYLR